MNVAIFASAFHPSLGGVEELVRQLAHAYREAGVSVIVVTNRWPRSLPAFEEYEGIPVYRLAMRIPEGNLKARLNYTLTGGAIRSEMIDILKQRKIDLLHIQCVSSNGYYVRIAREALKLPLVVTVQGERTMDAGRIYETSSLINDTLRALLAEADFITGCSRDTVADVERFFGKPFGDRAKVVYNGIRLQDFDDPKPFSHPRPYVLGIGRMVPQKGFDLLINAFAQADPSDHDLLLAGDGAEKESLEQLARDRNVADRVRFVGRADRPTAVSLFQGCAFFVLPSRMEPQGIVNLEAMAAGKAILAARVGGVPEIVLENQTGLLFPGSDVDGLAAGITRLTTDADLRSQLGAAGKERAQEFGWTAVARQYLDIYEAVLRKRPS